MLALAACRWGQTVSDSEIAALSTGVLVEGPSPAGAPPVTITNLSRLSGGGHAVRSVGNPIRIEDSTIENSGVGVQMESTAILDLSNSAGVTFIGNTTSIGLVGAGTPALDGSNLFYPKTTTTNGFTLSGTISNTAPCSTPSHAHRDVGRLARLEPRDRRLPRAANA